MVVGHEASGKEEDMLKMAIITGFLSQTKGPVPRIQQPLRIGREIRSVEQDRRLHGVEIVYPYEVSDDPAATRTLLDKYGLMSRPSTSMSRRNRNFATAA
jgi:hypothetical protein